MQAPLKWLKDYVEISAAPEQIADKLTMAGVPVETIEYPGEKINKVVTGKIVDSNPHRSADRLTVCRVDVGDGILTIVTGAQNISSGCVVPVARVGSVLPDGTEIKAAELRGVSSEGMLCSAAELNIDSKLVAEESKNGIYILPPDSPVGEDIRSVLGIDQPVLNFELTANRADCFSIIGLAREVGVLTGRNVKKPMLNIREDEEKCSEQIKVKIVEPALCSRFTARLLKDVKIGPSPNWLSQRIQAAGMRPINNVVDVTNFVMLEMGQPMHAYDYDLLAKHEIVVRKARPGERLTTLDGTKRELSPDMLVIADAVQAVGLAGVMGGLTTEVTANTRSVLLEAAAFNGASIRRTSRKLGLRSEASGRFERGVDTANLIRALDRAAQLLQEMGACRVCTGLIDNYPGLALPAQISFTRQQVNDYLGTDISRPVMIDILRKLEFAVEEAGDLITATVPSWRADVTGRADICEEIARIVGYNNIPSTAPVGRIAQGGQSYQQTIVDRIKEILTGLGLDEIINFSFMHPEALEKLNIPDNSELRSPIPVINPITDEFPAMRTTLLDGILRTVAYNLARKNEQLKIYEIGSVYFPPSLPLTAPPEEPLMLGGALTGQRYATSWSQPAAGVDFYDVKEIVEVLLRKLGITDFTVTAGQQASLHLGKTALFKCGETVCAVAGEVHPQVLENYGLSKPVYIFEVNVRQLVDRANLLTKYKQLPKFPPVIRDIAIVLADNIEAGKVLAAINDSAGPVLDDIKLFDVYTGEQVPAGCHSLAISLTFQGFDRTLTDGEVDKYCHDAVTRLENQFAAKLRK